MMIKPLKYLLASTLSVLLIGQAQAASCEISGQNLLVAYEKARSNGFKFACGMLKKKTKFLKGKPRPYWHFSNNKKLYSLPGRLGCKGRALTSQHVRAKFFAGKTKHGWSIVDVQARGQPGTIKKNLAANSVRASVYRVTLSGKANIGQSFDYYIRKLILRHPSKSCGNIQSTLTDAFGQ